MKLVKESISFQRGLDPKEVLGIGDPLFLEIISEEVKKIMLEFNGNSFEKESRLEIKESIAGFTIDHIYFYILYEKKEKRIGFKAGYFGYLMPVLGKRYAQYVNKSRKCKTLKGAVVILKRFIKELEDQ